MDNEQQSKNEFSPNNGSESGSASNDSSNRFLSPLSDQEKYFPNYFDLTIQIEEPEEIASKLFPIKNEYEDFYQHTQTYSILLNKGIKESMEDRFHVSIELPSNPDFDLYAVFDGHGSDKVADFLSQNIAHYIDEALQVNPVPENALKLAFQSLDEYIKTEEKLQARTSGSVATVALIHKNKQIYTANLGDCRAMVISKTSYKYLTKDHNPSRPDEMERITRTGGFCIPVRNSLRLMGSLNVSRSFGDLVYRPHLIAEPEITTYDIGNDDHILLIGSDGLFNEYQEQEIIQICSCRESSCKDLYDNIIQKKGQFSDNVAIVSVDLDAKMKVKYSHQ